MTTLQEEWRPVVGYEGIYEVSSHGRVKRVAAKRGATVGRIQRLRYRGLEGSQYAVAALYDLEGTRTEHANHRLVALAFLGGPPEPDYVINHKNGDKKDNHVDNLEWITFRENIQHAWETGLQKRGEGHVRAKLTERQVLTIRSLHGELSQRALARRYGVAKGVIQAILERRTWTHI